MMSGVVEGDVAAYRAAGDDRLAETQSFHEGMHEFRVRMDAAVRLPVDRIGARVPRQIQRIGVKALLSIERQNILVLK